MKDMQKLQDKADALDKKVQHLPNKAEALIADAWYAEAVKTLEDAAQNVKDSFSALLKEAQNKENDNSLISLMQKPQNVHNAYNSFLKTKESILAKAKQDCLGGLHKVEKPAKGECTDDN